jgi:hypothetical protein
MNYQSQRLDDAGARVIRISDRCATTAETK